MHPFGPVVHWTQRLLPLAFLVALAGGVPAVVRSAASADTLALVASGGSLAACAIHAGGGAFNRYFGRRLLLAALGAGAAFAVPGPLQKRAAPRKACEERLVNLRMNVYSLKK